MSSTQISSPRFLTTSRSRWLIATVIIVSIIAVAAWVTLGQWLPLLSRGPGMLPSAQPEPSAAEQEHDHGHDHDHAGHSEETSIELSQNALKNIGFQPVTVELGTFERTIAIPAIVAEQPGRTQVHITAPLTGVVTNIYVVQGQAIRDERFLG